MDIRINCLNKSFNGKKAIDINGLEIKEGDILGIVGNNGAGKTTLFRLMLDLLKADEGLVTMVLNKEDGKTYEINTADSEEWKPFVGAYLDESFLIDFLTPEEYFDFIGKIYNMDENVIRMRLDTFRQFMNDEILGQNKFIRDLSAGNKQKIGIIAALFNAPKLIILDEPFNFLDPSSQNSLKSILSYYNKEFHSTILISSHNLQHTIEISNRIALLEHGFIIKDLSNIDNSAKQELYDYFNQ